MQTMIGFSTTNNPGSAIIRDLTGSKVSHTWFLYYDDDLELEMVMEAADLGYRVIPFELFKRENNIVAVFNPGTNIDAGIRAAAMWLGERYSYEGLLGFTWVLLGRWLKRKWNNPFRSSKALFCSEAVVRGLQAANFAGVADLSAPETNPEDLYERCLALKLQPFPV